MKKFVFGIVGISFIGTIGLGIFSWSGGINMLNLPMQSLPEQIDTEIEVDDFFDTEIEDIDEISGILEELIVEEDEDLEEEVSRPVPSRPVPGRTRAANLYENAFIRFSYPSFIEFRDETLNFLSVWNNDTDTREGTINIYNNVEELSLEEFVQRDNIIDYFTESEAKGLQFEEFEIPTATRTVKFPDYPEIDTADIFLIEFSGLVVLAKDFSEDKIVGEYLLKSMEKSR